MTKRSSTWRTWSGADWAAADPEDVPSTHSAAAWGNRIERERHGRPAPRRTRGGGSLGDIIRRLDPDYVPVGVVREAEERRAAEDAARRERDEQLDREARQWVEDILADADRKQAAAAVDASIRARGGVTAVTSPPQPELHFSTLKVGNEPAVYGPGSDYSYMRDRFLDMTHETGGAIPSRRYGDSIRTVRDRLRRNDRQVGYLGRCGDDATRALIRDYYTERARPYHGTVSDHSADAWRYLVFGEIRDVTTTSGSMGDFAPPVYLLQQWQKFRTAASPVASQAGQRPLPKTGMAVDIPSFTSKVSVAEQATQNTGIAGSTPTAAFITAPVVTLAGGVSLSQQLLDRMGPGVGTDEVLTEQAAREAATVLDTLAITAILTAMPTANKITNSGSPGIAELWSDVGKGSAKLSTIEGTRLPPTHLVMPPANSDWFKAQVDTEGRPIWTPSAAGTAARIGQATTAQEGYTGFDVQGALVFEDANLSITPHATLLLGNLPRGLLVQTGAPFIDVFPEFEPGQLTVLFRYRQYVALSVLYPSAFVKITGAAYPKTPTFANS